MLNMMSLTALLPADSRLRERSRLPALAASGGAVGIGEVLTLLAMGTGAAALATFVRLRLGIPGHQIVYSIFPMALGFALVPRRRAGSVRGMGALIATLAFTAGGAAIGAGALTALVITGPFLDLALRAGGRGRGLYPAFLLAGTLSNLVAMLVRGSVKILGVPGLAGTRPFASWAPEAVVSYTLAGLVAGGLSAAAWFHVRGSRATG
jgi:hypothetical protein